MMQRCMASRAIAKRAIEFRVANGLAFEDPCDIYEVVCRHGIELQFVDIPSLEGMYLEEPETQRICVCAHRPVGRQRYTTAHELGHHLLGHGSRIDTVVDDLGKVTTLTPEEKAADTFARYILMPPRAVQVAFRARGFDLTAMEPVAVYRAACWLGVGYITLLNQMWYSLGILQPSHYKRLSKMSPKTIKTKLTGGTPQSDVWPLDGLWANRKLHAQLGDLIIGLQPGHSTQTLTESDDGIYVASSVGESISPLVTGGTLTICVSRAAYVGFYDYRYLPE